MEFDIKDIEMLSDLAYKQNPPLIKLRMGKKLL